MALIIILDPYPVMGVGVTQIFRDYGAKMEVLPVASIEVLAQLAGKVEPDILVLTVNTPRHQDPRPVIAECKTIFPGLPIVLYDEEHRRATSQEWLAADIAGYLFKSESPEILLQCLNAVLIGRQYFSPLTSNWCLSEMPGYVIPRPVNLGRKEMQIARFLSEGQSTNWIARELGRKPSTISTVKKRILSKFGVTNALDLARVMPEMTIHIAKLPDASDEEE